MSQPADYDKLHYGTAKKWIGGKYRLSQEGVPSPRGSSNPKGMSIFRLLAVMLGVIVLLLWEMPCFACGGNPT
jgi:hypothetical protein